MSLEFLVDHKNSHTITNVVRHFSNMTYYLFSLTYTILQRLTLQENSQQFLVLDRYYDSRENYSLFISNYCETIRVQKKV